MKKIMQAVLVCLLAMSTTAYAGDNHACTKNCDHKTCSAVCQAACKKTGCSKACGTTTVQKKNTGAKKA